MARLGFTSHEDDTSVPDHVPTIVPPLTVAELKADLRERSGLEPPSFDEGFSFCHLDLSTQNIFVTDPLPEDRGFWGMFNPWRPPLLAGLIDWGYAGFVPKWYFFELLKDTHVLELDWDKGEDDAWQKELLSSLRLHGFRKLPWLKQHDLAILAKKGFILRNGVPIRAEKVQREGKPQTSGVIPESWLASRSPGSGAWRNRGSRPRKMQHVAGMDQG